MLCFYYESGERIVRKKLHAIAKLIIFEARALLQGSRSDGRRPPEGFNTSAEKHACAVTCLECDHYYLWDIWCANVILLFLSYSM
jgi:hypothetical protein